MADGDRAAARAACVTGRCMPKDGNDKLLRRVLYGISGDAATAAVVVVVATSAVSAVMELAFEEVVWRRGRGGFAMGILRV